MSLLVEVKKKKIKNMQQFREAAAKAFAKIKIPPENAGEVFKATQIYFKNRQASKHSSKAEQRLYEQDFGKYIRQCNEMTSAFDPLSKPEAIFSNQENVKKFFEENEFKVRILKTLKAPDRGNGTEPICYAVYVEKR